MADLEKLHKLKENLRTNTLEIARLETRLNAFKNKNGEYLQTQEYINFSNIEKLYNSDSFKVQVWSSGERRFYNISSGRITEGSYVSGGYYYNQPILIDYYKNVYVSGYYTYDSHSYKVYVLLNGSYASNNQITLPSFGAIGYPFKSFSSSAAVTYSNYYYYHNGYAWSNYTRRTYYPQSSTLLSQANTEIVKILPELREWIKQNYQFSAYQNKTYNAAKAELDAFTKAEIAKIEKELNNLKAANTTLANEMPNIEELNEFLEQIQNEIKELQALKAALEVENNNLEVEKQNLETHKAQLQSSAEVLAEALIAIREEAKKAQDELEKQQIEYRIEGEARERQKKELQIEMDELEAQSKKEINELYLQQAQKQLKIAQAKSTIDSIAKENKELDKLLSDNEAQILALAAHNNLKKSQIDENNKLINTLNAQNPNIEQIIAAQIAELEKIKQDLAQKEAQAIELEKMRVNAAIRTQSAINPQNKSLLAEILKDFEKQKNEAINEILAPLFKALKG